ncbi:hypothetical protein Q5752_000196 [Cryptotrichosporon argae]
MSSSAAAPSSASASASASRSGSITASASASGSAAASSSNSSTVSVPQTAADGGISMVQPASTGSASFYKIASADYITFKWNFTSLYVQPKSLTIIASCSANGNTYQVGPTASPSNTLPGNATQVVWNPWEWAQLPSQTAFAEATYTLSIWDERGPTAAATGGYMSVYDGTEFAMYIPQSYTPLASGWTCSTCSGALRTLGEPAGLSMLVSAVIMVVTGLMVLRR